VLRVVVGTGIYLTLNGVIGGCIGWIVRSTPGALVVFVALLLVLPVLFSQALGTLGMNIGKFFPSLAGGRFAESVPARYALTPWWGLAVLAGWAVVGLVVALVVLRSRDA
jgi:hypothetical protein